MKVSVIVVIYEGKKFIKPVFDAVFSQTHKDLEVIAVINKSTDGGKEEILNNYPQVKIIDPARNTGFAEGNNLGIKASTGEFIQLVNQDLILEPNYIEEILRAFKDSQVAAATGKLLRFDFDKLEKTKIIDTTGVVMQKSGRARDRGQNQIDTGQFDDQPEVFGVSGAGPMYRKSALDKVKYQQEYFDENFFMYWEDVDLSWRLNNAGFKNIFVPTAIAYHGRTAGQSKGGYLHLFKFIRHHSKLSKQILRFNFKNHILMYLKNAAYIHPMFILREMAMLGYILVFETSTLKVIPELFRQIPETLKKRRVMLSEAKHL
ncbi:MAG TPA: glycosyltransferase family 2 protein [Methylomirabilota bacterium]|nr:glycosyltransferase family 2 protein [Methylomirabilota bacterium]